MGSSPGSSDGLTVHSRRNAATALRMSGVFSAFSGWLGSCRRRPPAYRYLRVVWQVAAARQREKGIPPSSHAIAVHDRSSPVLDGEVGTGHNTLSDAELLHQTRRGSTFAAHGTDAAPPRISTRDTHCRAS